MLRTPVQIVTRQRRPVDPYGVGSSAFLAGIQVVSGIGVIHPAAQRYADVESEYLISVVHPSAGTAIDTARCRVLVVAVVQPVADAIPAIVVTCSNRAHGAVTVPVIFTHPAQRQCPRPVPQVLTDGQFGTVASTLNQRLAILVTVSVQYFLQAVVTIG
ncbi:hypothetical protein D3C80_1408810 [compost metagenome]